jgi:hypothetical protein
MGPEFMRAVIAGVDIRGQEKIVRPEFGTH